MLVCIVFLSLILFLKWYDVYELDVLYDSCRYRVRGYLLKVEDNMFCCLIVRIWWLFLS